MMLGLIIGLLMFHVVIASEYTLKEACGNSLSEETEEFICDFVNKGVYVAETNFHDLKKVIFNRLTDSVFDMENLCCVRQLQILNTEFDQFTACQHVTNNELQVQVLFGSEEKLCAAVQNETVTESQEQRISSTSLKSSTSSQKPSTPRALSTAFQTSSRRQASNAPFQAPSTRQASTTPFQTSNRRQASNAPFQTPSTRQASTTPFQTPTTSQASTTPFQTSSRRQASNAPFQTPSTRQASTTPFQTPSTSQASTTPFQASSTCQASSRQPEPVLPSTQLNPDPASVSTHMQWIIGLAVPGGLSFMTLIGVLIAVRYKWLSIKQLKVDNSGIQFSFMSVPSENVTSTSFITSDEQGSSEAGCPEADSPVSDVSVQVDNEQVRNEAVSSEQVSNEADCPAGRTRSKTN